MELFIAIKSYVVQRLVEPVEDQTVETGQVENLVAAKDSFRVLVYVN